MESRQLLAGFSANFNFQPASSQTPAGYFADAGKAFAWQNNLQYGWNTNNTGNVVDRYTSADARYDTFAYIGKSGGASTWEVAVPAGQYRVQITAGDASVVDGHYGIAVEGATIINESPNWSNKWSEGSGSVWVGDGRLTVSSSPGAWNNKITSIQITSVSGNTGGATGSGVAAPAVPGWTASWATSSTSASINWGDNSSNEIGFIVEQSTDGKNFWEAARVGANKTNYIAQGLSAGTKYTFRVKAYNAGGSSAASSTTSFTTFGSPAPAPAPTPPAAAKPTNFGWTSSTTLGANSVGIGWSDVSNETGYIIERSTNGSNFSERARVNANTVWYVDNNLNSSTKYYYRITAYNNGGTITGPTTSSTTHAGSNPSVPSVPTVSAPSAPGWFSAVNGISGVAHLAWGDVSNETGYVIERSTNNGSSFSEAARVGANATTAVVSGLASGTKYVFRVKAYNNGGTSTASPQQTLTTAGAANVSPPGAPSWFGAQANGAYAANLQWGDVSNETGYIIERSTNNGSSFSEVARVGANVTSTTINGLAASTKYVFRVRAYNSGGNSAASAQQTITTAAAPVTVYAPGAPGWLSAQANGQTGANLQWGDVSNETGYVIERSSNNGSSFSEAARVGANVTSTTVWGLSAGTKYVFRVKAYNSGGTSAASPQQTITTAAGTSGSGGSSGSSTITNKLALSGISANGSGTSAYTYKATLDDVGVKNVRIWYSITNWNDNGHNAWYTERAVSYKNAGYKVMLAVLNPNPTDYNTAKAFFNRIASNAQLRNAVDYWQIGNEPNYPQFWYGSASQYVNNMLKPAYEALKAVGETVVGAAPTWDVNYAKTLTSLGYTNYCDYSAFHAYGDNAAQVIERAAGAKAAFNNKPIMITEWNITGLQNNTSAWVTELNKAAVGLSQIAHTAYYFALVNSNTHVGSGGLLKTDGSRNTPFYDAMKGWLR